MSAGIVWSVETDRDRCPRCLRETMTVTLPRAEPQFEMLASGDHAIDLHEEISGHFCKHCRRLTMLSLNLR